MDRLTVLQEAIARTENAARRYRPTGTFQISGSDILTSAARDGWTVGALQRILLDIADDHAGCRQGDCRTCAAVRDGLAVSLSGLRNLQREQLEATVRQATSTPWWRRNLRD